MERREHRCGNRPESAVADAEHELDRGCASYRAMCAKELPHRPQEAAVRGARSGLCTGEPRPQHGDDQEQHAGREHVAVAPADVRRDQSADDAREQDAAEHRHQLRADCAAAMVGMRDFRGDRDEAQPQRRNDPGHEAPCRQHPDRRRCRHHRLRQHEHDDLGEHQPALVDAISQRHEKKNAHHHAAERERRYPAGCRGIGLKLRRDRRQHRGLIMNAARDDERGDDHEGDETAVLRRGCRLAGQWLSWCEVYLDLVRSLQQSLPAAMINEVERMAAKLRRSLGDRPSESPSVYRPRLARRLESFSLYRACVMGYVSNHVRIEKPGSSARISSASHSAAFLSPASTFAAAR